MSAKSFIVHSALQKVTQSELVEFMNEACVETFESVAPKFISDWMFEFEDGETEKWNELVTQRNYTALHHLISDFESEIVSQFECTTYVYGIQHNGENMSHTVFRTLVCSMYVTIFADYIGYVYPGFEEIVKIVYDYIFEESDEGSEDIM